MKSRKDWFSGATRPRNGADGVCAALEAAGVDTVFGLPGTQSIPFYEGLRRAGIRTVTATSETGASFMAQGYYRASGRLAAVSVIAGPGFAYTLAALAEAKLDSSALVLLTGRPAALVDGRPRSQAIDQEAVARPLVKAILDVELAPDAGRTVLQACEHAVAGEPGPVVVQFGPQAFSGECPDDPENVQEHRQPASCPGATLRDASRFLVGAERVVVYAGQGAAGAAEQLRRLVRDLGAVVATTPAGRGIIPENDPRLLPFDATGDTAALNAILAESDAVLVVGAGLAENGSGAFRLRFQPETLIRVDTSAEVLARPPAARFSVEAQAERFFAVALEEAASVGRSDEAGFDIERAECLRSGFRARPLDAPSEARVGGGSARDFFLALRRALPRDGRLVLDSGRHQLLARRHFEVLAARGLLFPADFQCMGFGLPAAIGAKLAAPSSAIVAVIGDGGAAMTGLELLTAVRLRLPLPVIVLDDGALGLIRMEQVLTYGRPHGTVLGGLDFRALAAAVGCEYVRAGIDDLEISIRRALGVQTPTLVVAPVEEAPSLRHAQAALLRREAAKSLAGPRLVGLFRSLRDRWGRLPS